MYLNVDVQNPGQFFACCGLFELAYRQGSGEVESWFSDDQFHLAGEPVDLVENLLSCEIKDDKDDGSIWIGAPFNLRVNWWFNLKANGWQIRHGFGPLKTWAGQQKPGDIMSCSRDALVSRGLEPDCFDYGTVVKRKPFYHDSRMNMWSSALDTGWSNNEEKLKIITFPAVDTLSVIGLQRFLPKRNDEHLKYTYVPWQQPYPIAVAAMVASAAIPEHGSDIYQFSARPQGGQGYYSLAHARLITKESQSEI